MDEVALILREMMEEVGRSFLKTAPVEVQVVVESSRVEKWHLLLIPRFWIQ
jgi:hypothetical protein